MEHILVKLSGSTVDNPEELRRLPELIEKYRRKGISLVLTHGGGVQINALSKRLQIPVRQLEGRRITDDETLDVLLMSVAGTVNTRLVHHLVSNEIPAVGLTGIDGMLTTAKRRKPIEIGGNLVDFGLVGELESVNNRLLTTLLTADFIPVVACLTWHKESPLNINADTLANRLALEIGASEMITLSDISAVWDAEKKPIRKLNKTMFLQGKSEGWIVAGMIPKLETAFETVKAGIGSVTIGNMASILEDKATILSGDFDL